MKFFITIVFAMIGALASIVSAQWYIPGYCEKSCKVTDTLVCAWNGRCHNMFRDNCQMKKWNCDMNDDFVAGQTMNCLFNKQCQHIPAIID